MGREEQTLKRCPYLRKMLLVVLGTLSATIFVGAIRVKVIGSCFLVRTLGAFEIAIPIIIRTSEIGHTEYLLKIFITKALSPLLALDPTQQRNQNGATIWRCRCDCGNEVFTPITQLVNGYKKSCGSLSNPPLKDYVGKRFGQLTVLGYWGKKDGMHRWECRCDCGNLTVVGQTLLQTGKTKSCGCLQAKVLVNNMKFVDGTSVTQLENASKRLISTNTSGYNGVYKSKKTGKWNAQICFKSKTYYLGSYDKIEDAVQARKKAEDRIYGEFLEWYYKTRISQMQEEQNS